jgi:23S rRNA (cytidine1920-2'-O)/16S rRNA (cytidine1409-2'-O)-methyltransferase
MPEVEAVVADVSFVSLTKILAHAKKIVPKTADYLVMLKPQFEARPDQLWKGVVKNEKVRREIIKNFEFWLKNNDFVILNKRDNEVIGKNGNKERFYFVRIAKKA